MSDEREREMYRLRISDGLTLRQLAEQFGIGPERVRQLLNRYVRQTTGGSVNAKAMSRTAATARRAKDLARAQAQAGELLAAWRGRTYARADRKDVQSALPQRRAGHPRRGDRRRSRRARIRTHAGDNAGERDEAVNANPVVLLYGDEHANLVLADELRSTVCGSAAPAIPRWCLIRVASALLPRQAVSPFSSGLAPSALAAVLAVMRAEHLPFDS